MGHQSVPYSWNGAVEVGKEFHPHHVCLSDVKSSNTDTFRFKFASAECILTLSQSILCCFGSTRGLLPYRLEQDSIRSLTSC